MTHTAPPSDEDEGLLVAFLAGSHAARESFPRRVHQAMIAQAGMIARSRAPILLKWDVVEDVVQRTWEILLQMPAGSYDPAQCSVVTFLRCVLRRAIADVCASYA
jgi:hypothetical protein